MDYQPMPFSSPFPPPFAPGPQHGCGCHEEDILFPTHKVPQVPILIDDERVEPRMIRNFAGSPLHTIFTEDEPELLRIFTTRENVEAHVREHSKQSSGSSEASQAPTNTSPGPVQSTSQALTAGIPPEGGYIELYEHIDWGGCSWRAFEGTTRNVGDYRTWGACGFLWWGWISADNRISSADVRVSADWVTFFDLPNLNFSGSTFWVRGDSWIPNLVPFGWNDRFSSHMLWYFA